MRINLYLFIFYCLVLNLISSSGNEIRSKRYTIIERYDEDKYNQFFSNNHLRSSDYEGVESERWLNDFNPETDTHFLLFTRENAFEAQTILYNDTNSLKNSNFDAKNPIRFLIHGFRDGPGAFVNRYGTNALLEHGNYNIIVVNWSKGADTINYLEAKDRVYTVGPVISRFIEFLIDSYPDTVSLSKIQIIGHSLGSHVAGMAGKHIQGGKVAAIIGLDPAGPFFSYDKPGERLSTDNAEYVEVIHTDRTQQGFPNPIGHADFYPNSGKKQPGCGTDLTGACSHQRAVFYWAESINSQIGFWAKPCESYEKMLEGECFISEGHAAALMGGAEIFNEKAKGVYYLETASQSPFALGPIHDSKN